MSPPLAMLASLVAECLACRKVELVNAGLQVLIHVTVYLGFKMYLKQRGGQQGLQPRARNCVHAC